MVVLLAFCAVTVGGLPSLASGQLIEVKSPLLTGALGQFLIRYITAKGIDRKHGVAIDDTKAFASVATYYQEFFRGNADLSLGTWDSFADRHLAGVPVQMVCTLTRSDIAMVVVDEGRGSRRSPISRARRSRCRPARAPTGWRTCSSGSSTSSSSTGTSTS